MPDPTSHNLTIVGTIPAGPDTTNAGTEFFNDLRSKTDLPIVVFTADPGNCIEGIKTRSFATGSHPWMATLAAATEEFGDVLWLDGHHLLHGEIQGPVSPAKIEKELLPWLRVRQAERLPVWATRPRNWWANSEESSGVGLTYDDMTDLARACEIRPGSGYVCPAAALVLPETAKVIAEEFEGIKQRLTSRWPRGDEATVLSILRWRHRWLGVDAYEWARRLVADPIA